jgi:hypothetical protein
MIHINAVLKGIRHPKDIVSISFEVDNPIGSGSHECEAWLAQYEIEKLEKSGHRVIDVNLHQSF